MRKPGFKLTEEHKAKISEAHKRLSLLGKKSFRHTPEALRKIYDANIKYPLLWNKELMEEKYYKDGTQGYRRISHRLPYLEVDS